MRIRSANNRRRQRQTREWFALGDNCQVCQGEKGGVRGNENVINGLVVCDYCFCDGSYIKPLQMRTVP